MIYFNNNQQQVYERYCIVNTVFDFKNLNTCIDIYIYIYIPFKF